jgi:hypothetical protein
MAVIRHASLIALALALPEVKRASTLPDKPSFSPEGMVVFSLPRGVGEFRYTIDSDFDCGSVPIPSARELAVWWKRRRYAECERSGLGRSA